MRILLFFCFIAQAIFAQVPGEMPGGYFNFSGDGRNGEQFFFGVNHSFTYAAICDDCGTREGCGKYELDKDTLRLHFMPSCRMDTLRMVNGTLPRGGKYNDSIFFLVTIPGNHVFISVQLSDSTGTNLRNIGPLSGHYYYFGVRQNELSKFFLHISSPGYNEEWLHLSEIANETELTLMEGNYSIPPWVMFTYIYTPGGKNQVELRQIGGNASSPETKSRKFYRGKLN